MGDREHLIELGRKQGILLSPSDARLTKNAHYEIDPDDLLLIVSQTCDLIQGSFESEPYFEVLCLHPLDKEPDGGYRGGKNSRRIEFSLDDESSTKHWFALPHERHLIDRRLLLEDSLNPISSIEGEKTLPMILRWLSRRYTRTAFPEAFVGRIDVRKRQIGKNLSRLNAYVSNVYVRVIPFEELDEGTQYSIDLMLVMEAERFDDAEQYDQCNKIVKQLEDQLGKCAGISLDDIHIESTADVTIEELNMGYLEWDYSYLSFRDVDNAAMPIDI